MKRYLLLLCLFIGTMTTSCHCTNQDFEEFEGEYHDNRNDNSSKKGKIGGTIKDEKTQILGTEETNTLFQDRYDEKVVGIPEMIKSEQSILVKRKGYTLSYNCSYLIPNWVFWHLTAEHTDGPFKRLNAYIEDLSVPSPRAIEDDYRGTPWTHGHMCPAGDNKWDEDAMRESNLLTNICPQSAGLNSGLWNKIEQDCRKWAKQYGDLFIVCGPVLYDKEHETIGANKIVVPEAFFKVILCLQGIPKAIGFVIKNIEETGDQKGKKKKTAHYVNTVDDVERITGIDFFPALPDDIENEIEAHANLDDWR